MLKCGASEVKITPDLGMGIPGYFDTQRSTVLVRKSIGNGSGRQLCSGDCVRYNQSDAAGRP